MKGSGSTNITPMSDITSTVPSERNQNFTDSNGNFSTNPFMYTLPSTNQELFKTKRRAIHFDHMGFNLMSKFADIKGLPTNLQHANYPTNVLASSSNQNMSYASTSNLSSLHTHEETGHGYDSLEDEENLSDFDAALAQGLNSDCRSSSEEEDLYSNCIPTESSNLTQANSKIAECAWQRLCIFLVLILMPLLIFRDEKKRRRNKVTEQVVDEKIGQLRDRYNSNSSRLTMD